MRKLSKVFRAAKLDQLLPECLFVCCAIGQAGNLGRINGAEAKRAEAHIYELLDGHFTVTSWLEANGVPNAQFLPREMKNDYRRRWVAHIIKTLEEQGK